MAMRIHFVTFWAVTACGDVVGHRFIVLF